MRARWKGFQGDRGRTVLPKESPYARCHAANHSTEHAESDGFLPRNFVTDAAVLDVNMPQDGSTPQSPEKAQDPEESPESNQSLDVWEILRNSEAHLQAHQAVQAPGSLLFDQCPAPEDLEFPWSSPHDPSIEEPDQSLGEMNIRNASGSEGGGEPPWNRAEKDEPQGVWKQQDGANPGAWEQNAHETCGSWAQNEHETSGAWDEHDTWSPLIEEPDQSLGEVNIRNASGSEGGGEPPWNRAEKDEPQGVWKQQDGANPGAWEQNAHETCGSWAQNEHETSGAWDEHDTWSAEAQNDDDDDDEESWGAWKPKQNDSWASWNPIKDDTSNAWEPRENASWDAWEPRENASWDAWEPRENESWDAWAPREDESWDAWEPRDNESRNAWEPRWDAWEPRDNESWNAWEAREDETLGAKRYESGEVEANMQ